MTVMFPFTLNVVSLLVVIAIVVVGIFGSRRIRIAAVVGGVFWVVGLVAATLPAALDLPDAGQILFMLLSGIFHVFAMACLALAGMLPPRPVADSGPTYNPNPPTYGTSQSGGYDHLPRAGEAPRNFPPTKSFVLIVNRGRARLSRFIDHLEAS